MSHSKSSETFGSSSKARFSLLLTASLIFGLLFTECSCLVAPASAESEAGSEAGLEAPAYLRRRRGYRNQQARHQQQLQRAQALRAQKQQARANQPHPGRQGGGSGQQGMKIQSYHWKQK